MLFISYANESLRLDENLPACSQFHSDHRVNVSTYRYCQSAKFGPLAFCICSLFFYDIKSKRLLNRHISCDVYIRPECGSCPADVATAARPRTATHDHGRFYTFINIISFHDFRRFIFTGSCSVYIIMRQLSRAKPGNPASYYKAQYPVHWTDKSTSHFSSPGRPVHSDTNSASLVSGSQCSCSIMV